MDEEEKEQDPNRLDLNPDLLVEALLKFYDNQEDIAIKDPNYYNRSSGKKKSSYESEEQEAEREKKRQKANWQKLQGILSEQKLSVWKALSKALSKYYEMLVKRQDLIEETGLLNQQNEELKTLLNQYLQAGVN